MPFVTISEEEANATAQTRAPAYEKPVPRPAKSPAKSREIRAQNRRREYINRNPKYFASTEHEFADPLLYDALIRQHQTPAEREADGKRKGYSRVLEGDLARGEARLADLAKKAEESTVTPPGSAAAAATTVARLNPTVVDLDLLPPDGKDEAKERWYDFLADRFIHGQDEDFDYDVVDFDEAYDVMERQDAQDAWFEEEDPEWVSEPDEKTDQRQASRSGETGIQDF
ncbi:coiled-coil domain-containing protein [Plectosphaerella plurivora]|uniref:Coiled-coil domain-containing protein n=1 Tax=Plectosphaerella plurivora TaxID=936078 RepID=A0A9P9AC24_9PEZI|nr:coiled-coil domain-containing protein [Plectosphaerella plurivora]